MRNYSIDTIKFFAALAVVTIHTQPFKEINFELFFLIRVLSSFAVPYFFLVMGYLFFTKIIKQQYKLNDSVYITSYLKKIIIYILVTIVVYSLYHILKVSQSSDPNLLINNFYTEIFQIKNIYYGFDCAGMYHLWFLFILIWILPVLYYLREYIQWATIFS